MTELIEEVKRMISKELIRANKEHPLFRSDHEGLAIIGEEVWETKRDTERLKAAFRLLRYDTYTDEEQWCKHERVSKLETVATELAAEAIQVGAMCRKYKMSHDMDVPQEYVDYMTETCPEAHEHVTFYGDAFKEAYEDIKSKPEIDSATIITDEVKIIIERYEGEEKDAE